MVCAEYLLEIPTGCCRVKNRKFEFLIGADDKDGTAGQRHPLGIFLIGIDHTQFDGEISRFIRDYRVVERINFPVGFDIFDPLQMAFDSVAGQSREFDIPFVEFALQLGEFSEFCGADRCEVVGMRKKKTPP